MRRIGNAVLVVAAALPLAPATARADAVDDIASIAVGDFHPLDTRVAPKPPSPPPPPPGGEAPGKRPRADTRRRGHPVVGSRPGGG